MKILIVDDSRAMRVIVRRALAETDVGAGARVLEAADGREALEVVRAEQLDLILSDWNMPEMDGIELLRALTAEGSDVAFGFVTSESTPQMHEAAMSGGARFMVTKPFTPQSLGAALEGLA